MSIFIIDKEGVVLISENTYGSIQKGQNFIVAKTKNINEQIFSDKKFLTIEKAHLSDEEIKPYLNSFGEYGKDIYLYLGHKYGYIASQSIKQLYDETSKEVVAKAIMVEAHPVKNFFKFNLLKYIKR